MGVLFKCSQCKQTKYCRAPLKGKYCSKDCLRLYVQANSEQLPQREKPKVWELNQAKRLSKDNAQSAPTARSVTARCAHCQREFSYYGGKKIRYCTRKCREIHNGTRPEKWYQGLTTGEIGSWGELIVAADMMRRGWKVFRAVTPSSPCDMVAFKKDRIVRVEVTLARRGRTGKVYFPAHNEDNYDVLALVFPDSSIEYRNLD